eukprot:357756-Chlamydomonas_euryale.AAC.4
MGSGRHAQAPHRHHAPPRYAGCMHAAHLVVLQQYMRADVAPPARQSTQQRRQRPGRPAVELHDVAVDEAAAAGRGGDGIHDDERVEDLALGAGGMWRGVGGVDSVNCVVGTANTTTTDSKCLAETEEVDGLTAGASTAGAKPLCVWMAWGQKASMTWGQKASITPFRKCLSSTTTILYHSCSNNTRNNNPSPSSPPPSLPPVHRGIPYMGSRRVGPCPAHQQLVLHVPWWPELGALWPQLAAARACLPRARKAARHDGAIELHVVGSQNVAVGHGLVVGERHVRGVKHCD